MNDKSLMALQKVEKVVAELDAYKPVHLREVDSNHPVCDFAGKTADAYRKAADELVAEAQRDKESLYAYAEQIEKDAKDAALHVNGRLKRIHSMREELGKAHQRYSDDGDTSQMPPLSDRQQPGVSTTSPNSDDGS